MKGVASAVLRVWAVWAPPLGAAATAMQTLWLLNLYLRVGLMLAAATFSFLATSYFLRKWCAARPGYPNAEQKAAQRRRASLSRATIVLAAVVFVLLVRVVFDVSAIQFWQNQDSEGDKIVVYASLTSTEQLHVSLPKDGGCVPQNFAGRAHSDWRAYDLGGENPAISIQNFVFPEAVAAKCRPGTMTSAAIVDAVPTPPIKPLSGVEASRWHSGFLIWGVLLCALGLLWFQFRSRASG